MPSLCVPVTLPVREAFDVESQLEDEGDVSAVTPADVPAVPAVLAPATMRLTIASLRDFLLPSLIALVTSSLGTFQLVLLLDTAQATKCSSARASLFVLGTVFGCTLSFSLMNACSMFPPAAARLLDLPFMVSLPVKLVGALACCTLFELVLISSRTKAGQMNRKDLRNLSCIIISNMTIMVCVLIAGSPRMGRRILMRLVTYHYRQNLSMFFSDEGGKYHGTCVICLASWEEEDEIKITPCGHAFHTECLGQWLSRKPTCAFCRHDLSRPPSEAADGWKRATDISNPRGIAASSNVVTNVASSIHAPPTMAVEARATMTEPARSNFSAPRRQLTLISL